MRKVFKVVRTEVVITSDEEYAQLRQMIDSRKANDDEDEYGELLRAGTVLEVVVPHGKLVKGQMTIVRNDSFADCDGDYTVWYINKDDALESGYIKLANAKIWRPGKKAEPLKRGRRLKLDETIGG